MTRVVSRIGDVFAAPIDEAVRKCFLYVATDLSQLHSPVIRVFKESYEVTGELDVERVVQGEVEFHAHCMVNWGVKMGLWEKVGHVRDVGPADALFKNTNDYGDPDVEPGSCSQTWYVWRVGEPFRRVGRLEGEDRNAEIGIVVTPSDLVDRMRTGEYDFVYPRYE